MKTSVIIPTLNRHSELRNCLAAIAGNDVLPGEVIILEQGDIEATRVLASQFTIPITVIKFDTKSAAQARNAGAALASGDVFLFVDDDVLIRPDYISAAVNYFSDHPDILGITGRNLADAPVGKTGFSDKLKLAVAWFFWRWSFAPHSRVLLSGHNVTTNQSEEEMPAEWIPGLSCWRRTIFDTGFQFNPNFVRWSFGEDVMLSHQVHQAHPGKLRYVPSLQYDHHNSTDIRLPNPSIIKMKVVYRYIFWRACIYQGKAVRSIAFWWSQVGLMLFHLTEDPSWRTARNLAQTYAFLVKNRRAIARNEIDYNKFIVEA